MNGFSQDPLEYVCQWTVFQQISSHKSVIAGYIRSRKSSKYLLNSQILTFTREVVSVVMTPF